MPDRVAIAVAATDNHPATRAHPSGTELILSFAPDQNSMLNAKLVVVGGPTQSKEFKLNLPVTIGRARDVQIMFSHHLLSRTHCEIYERNGILRVRDMNSLNGTYVGSDRIVDATLPPDELLTVGAVTFRAVYEADHEAVLSALEADKELAEHLADTVGSPERHRGDRKNTNDTVNLNDLLEETDDFVGMRAASANRPPIPEPDTPPDEGR